jgi:transcriptional antiterminator NusG
LHEALVRRSRLFGFFEKSVAQALRDRIVRDGMEERFGDVLVPTEEVVEMRAGQKRRSERKFFRAMCWSRSRPTKKPAFRASTTKAGTWSRKTPRVMGFIGGTADRPLPIADSEAEAILNRVQEGVEKPRPKVLFEPGQMVRVTDGPFNDFVGVVEEVNYEKSRLRVSVLIFGRHPGRARVRPGRKGRRPVPSSSRADRSSARKPAWRPVSSVYLPLQACEEKPVIVRGPAGKASRTRPPQGGLQHDFKTRCRDA